MPKTGPPYDPEFRQRILELLHSGRTLKSLAEEFGCTEQSIRNWQRQGGRAAPERKEGLNSEEEEEEELARLRREVRLLREERDIPTPSGCNSSTSTGCCAAASALATRWCASEPSVATATPHRVCRLSIQHMQKALMQMNVQLHHVVTDITGVTGMKVLRAIVDRERPQASGPAPRPPVQGIRGDR